MSREMMEQREQSNACINSAESRKNKSEAQMRHSGIEWIGEIPKEWKVARIKTIFKERTELSETGTEKLLSVSEYYGVDSRASRIDEGEYLSRSESLVGYKKCYERDFVSNIMLAWKGSFGVTKIDGIVSPAYCVYQPSDSIYSYYYHYLFRTSLYTTRFKLFSRGIIDSRLRLYSPYFYDIEAIIPPLSEQQKIANYLDKVCGEVDEMIALQEQMIEELKAYKQSVITEAVTKGLNPNVPIKNSGIDWIGEIPEGWKICRIKNVAALFGRIGFRGYTSDDLNKDGDGAITLSPSNMIPMGMDFSKVTYLSWKKYEESPEIMIRNGDLLMVKTGSSYGKVSYVDNLPKEATINPQILRVVPSINHKYLGYYMQTDLFIYQVEGGVVGGTIPTISQEKINNFHVVLPPLSEQQSIVSYLDSKCSEIDALIAIKQAKIEELKDYKKSVIYEYVTGKKEVV